MMHEELSPEAAARMFAALSGTRRPGESQVDAALEEADVPRRVLRQLETHSRRLGILCLIAAAGFVLLAGVFMAVRGRDRWEYAVAAYMDKDWSDSFKGPAHDGAQGWEIISARRATGPGDDVAYECILKRRLP